MAGVCEVLCRSALQLGLGFAPHLTAPSNATGKAPTEGELVQCYSFHTAPSGLLGPLSDHRTFCLVGALLCLSVILFWGCSSTKGCCNVCQRKSWTISYLENSLNKISKINEVNYLPKIISLTKTSAEVLSVPQPKVRCDVVRSGMLIEFMCIFETIS